jgi:uncharacterized protein (TIGR03083 family)
MSDHPTTLRPLTPVLTLDLFTPLLAELITLLRSLGPEDWHRPTACALWSVRDIAAHLLDDDLRRLSFHRDKQPVPAAPLDNSGDLVALINAMNAEWVAVARRMSSRVLIDLLEVTGPQVVALFRAIDPFAPAHWPVAWAGEDRSAHWFDVGRDYTERWLHQQQIRDAVGAPPLTSRHWLHPVLDLFLRAVPPAYRAEERDPGTAVHLALAGEAGGDWTVRRERDDWRLWHGADRSAASVVRLSDDTGWRLFSKQLRPAALGSRVTIEGDQELGAIALGAVAVMA